jgi:hypothetical protein
VGCTALSGTYLGNGSNCANANFLCPGACCLNSGPCIVGTGISCFGTGTFLIGLTCTPNPCPRACCDNNIPNCTLTLQANCAGSGMIWMPNSTTCTPNPCVGACCLANFTCSQTTQANCPTPPNFSWTQGGPCGIFVCPRGVCCDPNTGACSISFGVCISPQTFIGSVTCTPNNPCPQPTGSCCLISGACQQLTAAQCAGILGASFQGIGVPCVPVTPCPGACCTSSGTCITSTNSGCSGVFQGPGTTCTPGLCPTGACCQANGTCTIRIPFNCPNFGGQTYLGNNTVCNPNPCIGACCKGPVFGGRGNMCVQTNPAGCTALGGQWRGFGTACASPPFSANLTTCCYANFNGTGGISVQDIFDFLTAYFGNNLSADCDGNNVLTVNDLFCFLAAYFSGCS